MIPFIEADGETINVFHIVRLDILKSGYKWYVRIHLSDGHMVMGSGKKSFNEAEESLDRTLNSIKHALEDDD